MIDPVVGGDNSYWRATVSTDPLQIIFKYLRGGGMSTQMVELAAHFYTNDWHQFRVEIRNWLVELLK